MRQTCLLMEVYTMEPYYSLRPSPQPPEEGEGVQQTSRKDC